MKEQLLATRVRVYTCSLGEEAPDLQDSRASSSAFRTYLLLPVRRSSSTSAPRTCGTCPMVKLGLCCLLRGLSCGLSANKFESGLRTAEAGGGGGLGETSRCRCRASLCQSLGLKAGQPRAVLRQPETAEGVPPNQGKTGGGNIDSAAKLGPCGKHGYLPKWVSKPLPGLRRSRSFRGSEIRSSGRRPASKNFFLGSWVLLSGRVWTLTGIPSLGSQGFRG